MAEQAPATLTAFERLVIAHREASYRRGAEIERDGRAAAQETDVAIAVREAEQALCDWSRGVVDEQPTDSTDLRAWAAKEQAQWEQERGHLTEHPCPGVEVHPDIMGGEPCIAGFRIGTRNLYDNWREDGVSLRKLRKFFCAGPLPLVDVRAAVAFEAGRRWGKRRTRDSGAALTRIEQALQAVLEEVRKR